MIIDTDPPKRWIRSIPRKSNGEVALMMLGTFFGLYFCIPKFRLFPTFAGSCFFSFF
jgi:hypothetical protein